MDYTETFSPVAKLTSVRVLLALASMHDWSIDHLDVHNAFFNGDLDETIYMFPPPGYLLKGENKVCKLNKSLYGWNSKFISHYKNISK